MKVIDMTQITDIKNIMEKSKNSWIERYSKRYDEQKKPDEMGKHEKAAWIIDRLIHCSLNPAEVLSKWEDEWPEYIEKAIEMDRIEQEELKCATNAEKK